MSRPTVDKEAIAKILHYIKDDDGEVNWTNFVLCAKQDILASSVGKSKVSSLRRYWIRVVKDVAVELGYHLNLTQDNWCIIERELKESEFIPTQSVDVVSDNQSIVSPTSTRRSPTSTRSSPTSTQSSSLDVPITPVKKAAALMLYSKMKDDEKWKLSSGRYVENIMQELVQELKFEHPSMYVILDLNDQNWINYFSENELEELQTYCTNVIDSNELPQDMHDFLKNVPKTQNLSVMYNYLETQIIDISTQSNLAWLKISIQSAIILFTSKYLPLSTQKERDICNRIWHFIGTAFDNSELTFRTEQQSLASQLLKNKKRKLCAVDAMDRQVNALIPDMVVSLAGIEYGLMEAAKEANNTKEIVEGGKKCPEMMNAMFCNMVERFPEIERSCKIYGCLLMRLKCIPLQLWSPKGYVKLFKKDQVLEFPESPLFFRAEFFKLLHFVWAMKLGMEDVLEKIVENQVKNSLF